MLTLFFLGFCEWGLERKMFQPNNIGCILAVIMWADVALVGVLGYVAIRLIGK